MKNCLKIVNMAAVFILATSGLAGTASANSSISGSSSGGVLCAGGGSIMSALWQGFNMTTGTNQTCDPGTYPLSGAGTAGQTPQTRSQTSPQNPPQTPQSNGNRPSANVVGGVQYVALGDSVAAGLGLPRQSGGNSACKVSYQAYPGYVASALGIPYSNVACSGATIGDLVTEQHLNNTSADVAPQLDAAFANGTPSFMTLTAGANDVQWQTFVRKCYSGNCGSATDQAAATTLVRAMQLKLNYALQSIARRSNGATPTVLITGYYRPFAANCPGQSSITAPEMQWLNAQTDALNYALASTARNYSFVRFVPVDFSGHELCSANPWIQGINDSAPAHPTAQGQWAIAQAVLGSMQGTTGRPGY